MFVEIEKNVYDSIIQNTPAFHALMAQQVFKLNGVSQQFFFLLEEDYN